MQCRAPPDNMMSCRFGEQPRAGCVVAGTLVRQHIHLAVKSSCGILQSAVSSLQFGVCSFEFAVSPPVSAVEGLQSTKWADHFALGRVAAVFTPCHRMT